MAGGGMVDAKSGNQLDKHCLSAYGNMGDIYGGSLYG